MKTIKRVTLPLLMLLLASSIFVSCADKNESDLTPDTPTPIPTPVDSDALQIDSSKITLRMEDNGSFSIKVSSKKEFECIVTSKNGNWITPQYSVKTYPKGKDVEVKFNFSTNYSGEDRTALLLFKNSDMSKYTHTVSVSQSKTLYINLKNSGTLSKEISNKKLDFYKIKNLILTGPLDSNDVLALRQMSGCGKTPEEITKGELADIDISGITLKNDGRIPYFITPGRQIKEYIYKEHILPDYMFAYCTSLKTIKLPTSINEIGEESFSNCLSLESVNIPKAVKTINKKAFYYSQLTNIDIPYGVESIDEEVFSGCLLLENVRIPNTIKEIEYAAFKGCPSLTRIDIPEGVTIINMYAFFGCSSLTTVTIPKTVTLINSGAFQNCKSLKNVIINITNPTTTLIPGSEPFDSKVNNATLYVPKGYLSVYKKPDFKFPKYFKDRIQEQQ